VGIGLWEAIKLVNVKYLVTLKNLLKHYIQGFKGKIIYSSAISKTSL